MKALICTVLLVLLASVFGSRGGSYGGSYGPGSHGAGFRVVGNGYAAAYRNDLRQVGVNRRADYVGSGTGTARYYGVPGTGNYFSYTRGYGGYNDGYGGDYGGGYGYNRGHTGGYGGSYNGGYGDGYNGGYYGGYRGQTNGYHWSG